MGHHGHGHNHLHDGLDMDAIYECMYGDERRMMRKAKAVTARLAAPIWYMLGIYDR
jgi:hypothetical protein